MIPLSPFSVINVKFESDSYAVSEGEEAKVCVVFEKEQLKKDVHLSVISRSDTAIIGQDYNMPSMLPLTLNPGTNHSCFAVDIIEDILVEGEETFQLILTSSDQAVLTSITDVLTVHIEDNDGERLSAVIIQNYHVNLLSLSSCQVWFGWGSVHCC